MRRFLVAAVLLAGCAASSARPPGPPTCGTASCDERDAETAHAKLRSLEAESHTIDATPAEPDCTKVNALTAKIWALTQLICQIAEQQPAGSPTHERCRDSKARSTKAFERADARGCGKK